VESGDRWLERWGSGMWQAGTSKVVAPVCQLRTDGLAPRASIERTDRMLVLMGPANRCSMLSIDSWLSLLLQWVCCEINWVADPWITQSG
jgi:hypothetical protein